MSTGVKTTRSQGRVRLDRSVVVDAALGIVDREGLDALTIRHLAQALSVTPMALYWHFKDKDALLAALGDQLWVDIAAVIDDVTSRSHDDDRWAPLRHTMEAMVEVLRRHPGVAPLAPAQVLRCDAGLEVTERTLAFLTGVGFAPRDATQMAVLALQSAIMLVGALPGADSDGPGSDEERRRAKRIALASLPPGRYPLVTTCLDDLLDCDEPDDYFSRGIDVVVAGARSQVPADRAGPESRPRR